MYIYIFDSFVIIESITRFLRMYMKVTDEVWLTEIN